ncbi:ATPase family associated with various cellular activities (AAA) [Loktanella salsilacus]|uniref:ATPase family associated with various cellular activities (AAA) n=1 Tax=Loktanella salsilacus TaxID=195913 RepID=A0A1I4I4N7_9RHOB|nr:AAA family ATPase [Loktanella salsilacus]SFL49120.1 ATPase family associated with various cellular activities (AAA) [Loktanella salsilacus]
MKIKIIEAGNVFLTRDKIEKRWRAFYKMLRQGKGLKSFDGIEIAEKHVMHDAHRVITRRTLKLHEAIRAASPLKTEELIKLGRIAGGVDAMTVTADRADEIAAAVHEEFGWLAPATQYVWHALRRAAEDGTPVRVPPVILVGPPGIGKSVWARFVAHQIGLPAVDIDASKGAVGFSINGTERGWSTAQPGRPVEMIISSRIANPLIIVDEICKSVSMTSEKGRRMSLEDALLSLLEPATAAAWDCPFYRVSFDMSHISWILTANTTDGIPAPLLSRCRVINLPPPTRGQTIVFACTMSGRRGLSDDAARAVIDAVKYADRSFSMRDIIKIVEHAHAIDDTTPYLLH